MLSLAGIVIPTLIGVLIQRWRLKWAKVILKTLKPVIFFMIVMSLSFGIWVKLYLFRQLSPWLFLAGMCLPCSGFLIAFIISLLFRRPRSEVIAITLETGFQKSSLALVTMELSLLQPQRDFAVLGVFAGAIFQFVPPLISYLIFTIWRLCKKTSEEKVSVEKKAKDVCVVPDTPAGSTDCLTVPNVSKTVPF